MQSLPPATGAVCPLARDLGANNGGGRQQGRANKVESINRPGGAGERQVKRRQAGWDMPVRIDGYIYLGPFPPQTPWWPSISSLALSV